MTLSPAAFPDDIVKVLLFTSATIATLSNVAEPILQLWYSAPVNPNNRA